MVICDTAGRLHTHGNLMEELAKVRRVIGKQIPDAPHETLIVIDATTGQNGVRQAQEFAKAVEVTGAVLTKLDGSAKGGDRARDRLRARHPGEADRDRRVARGPAALRRGGVRPGADRGVAGRVNRRYPGCKLPRTPLPVLGEPG